MLQPPPPRGGTSAVRRLQRIRRQPWLRRKRLWAGVLGTLLLLGSGSALLAARRQSSQQRSLSQYTVVARLGSLPGTITASGELMAYRKVNVSQIGRAHV